MMPSTYILFATLILVLSISLVLRRYWVRQECKLGYPRQGENFEDVKLLILLKKNIYALRCYRRVYPKASFAEAQYMINKLRKEFATITVQPTQLSGSLKK